MCSPATRGSASGQRSRPSAGRLGTYLKRSANMSKPNLFIDTLTARTERRACSRAAVSCNALVRLSDTLTFRCLVRNLSREAAQIVCDARYALLVQPAADTVGRFTRHRRLEMSIALPIAGNVSAFTAACVAKYCVPFEGDHMLLGLKFMDLDRASRALLVDFIAGHHAGSSR